MKKFYIFLAAAAAVVMGAQAKSLTFYMGETEIVPGSTVSYNEMTVVGDYGSEGMTYKFDPELSLLGDAAGTVNVVADCTSGHSIAMCCGGECVNGKKVEKNNVMISAGTKLPLQFDFVSDTYSDTEEPAKDIVTNISGVYTDDDSSLKEFTIILNNSSAKVTVLEVDNALRFANGALNYNIDGAANVALYNAEGKCVLNQNVNGTGAISTTGLESGIYVYTIGNKSGKIYVR